MKTKSTAWEPAKLSFSIQDIKDQNDQLTRQTMRAQAIYIALSVVCISALTTLTIAAILLTAR